MCGSEGIDMTRDPDLPPISALTLWFLRRVARRYFRRHFRSVMAQRLHVLRQARGPLIVYGNHSSWWDPLLLVLLGKIALPRERHYAPMDAEALQRYPIFRRLGVFPVEMTSARGAAMFLRTSTAVLRSGGILWITPQGRFADPRADALAFKPGIGALATRMPEIPLVPMAIEYTFWDERLPETLLRLGDPLRVDAAASSSTATSQLEAALAGEMAALRTASMERDASAFEAVMSGRRGAGGLYGLLRRARAVASGKRWEQDHTPRPR